MKKTRRRFTREFKLSVLREHDNGMSWGELARKYEVHATVISRWKREYNKNPDEAFKGNGTTYKEDARIGELERMVGQLYAENEFLKKTMASLEKRLQEGKARERRR